jgi:Carboxypeptidase regulatory-like domain/Divergent InlB B-repeat domain
LKSKFWAVGIACFLLFCVAPASALAGSIVGKITAVGGAPIDGARACVREVGGNGHASCAQANQEGEYAITAIAPDTYKLYFEEPQGGPEYLVNYWPEKATYDEAEVLQIGSGETTVANAKLVAAGRIEGTLTAEGETPSFGEICAYGADTIRVGCAQVVGASEYRIANLAPGSYTVGFFISGYRTQYSGGVAEFADATPVTVQAGASASASADLASNPGISGTVTAQDTGDPIENVHVCVLDGGRGTCVSTDEHGKYDIEIGGGTYSVWFKGDGYATQYYDGADDEAHETKVTVDESLVHGIDAALEDAGSIKGQVDTSDGRETFGNIKVCALTAGIEECTNADSSGAYELLSLAPGSYKVRFSLHGYFTQFFDDKATEAEAESVTVTANHESGGVDATLVAEEAPTNITPPLVSGVGKVGETLSCSNGVWTGNPPSFTYEYFWFREEDEEEEVIQGAESNTYSVGIADAGDSIYCAVVATNSAGSEYEFSSNEIVVPWLGTVSVTKEGGGSGTVLSAPAGIACGVSCSALFEEGTAITLTAVADSGSEFTGWSGACSGTGPCAFTLGAEAEVVANFAKTRSGGGANRVSNPPATPAPTTPAPVRTPKKKKPLRCKKGFHKAKHQGKVRCLKPKPKPKHEGGGTAKGGRG